MLMGLQGTLFPHPQNVSFIHKLYETFPMFQNTSHPQIVMSFHKLSGNSTIRRSPSTEYYVIIQGWPPSLSFFQTNTK